jgi:hypothetical protein
MKSTFSSNDSPPAVIVLYVLDEPFNARVPIFLLKILFRLRLRGGIAREAAASRAFARGLPRASNLEQFVKPFLLKARSLTESSSGAARSSEKPPPVLPVHHQPVTINPPPLSLSLSLSLSVAPFFSQLWLVRALEK